MKAVFAMIFILLPIFVFGEDKLVYDVTDENEHVKVVSSETIDERKSEFIVIDDYRDLFIDKIKEDNIRNSVAKITYKIPRGNFRLIEDIGFVRYISNIIWIELQYSIGEKYKESYKKYNKIIWKNRTVFYKERVFTSEDHEGLEGKNSLIVAELVGGAWYSVQVIFNKKNRIDAYKTAFSLNVEMINKEDNKSDK